MKTMGCGSMLPSKERNIKAGICKVISMPIYSQFVVNYHKYGLTHISLPNNYAVEITGTAQCEKLNKITGKMITYIDFGLGRIVPRNPADNMRNQHQRNQDSAPIGTTLCILQSDVDWNDNRFNRGQKMWYKISKYDTVRGKRYLIFSGTNFQTGLDRDEFKQLFEVAS